MDTDHRIYLGRFKLYTIPRMWHYKETLDLVEISFKEK